MNTADLYDEHAGIIQVSAPIWRNFGANTHFNGPVTTLKLFEDNTLVRETLSGPGDGGVLVVDGGGSLRCALVGDLLAALAVENQWNGIIVYGCIRDSLAISTMPIGIRALATHPAKSQKLGAGQKNVAVRFGDVLYAPGGHVYADADGVVLAPHPLQLTD